MVIVQRFFKQPIMKKAIVLLAIGFSFTYCNPSQQAEQTTADTSRTTTSSMTDTSSSTTPTPDTTSKPMPTDTTHHPDSTNH